MRFIDLSAERTAAVPVQMQNKIQRFGCGNARFCLAVVVSNHNKAPGRQAGEERLVVQRRRVACVCHNDQRVFLIGVSSADRYQIRK